VGIELASRVTTIALEFVIPTVLGYGFDYWLGTIPWATIVGLVLGFALGCWQIRRLARALPGGPTRPPATDR
jgi:F0F1-type ATP synthase assembly protein I